MCPDGEGPGCVADEVGVEGADDKVVDGPVLAGFYRRVLDLRTPETLVPAGVVQLGDGNALTIVAHQ